jgi:hypothetical protein
MASQQAVLNRQSPIQLFGKSKEPLVIPLSGDARAKIMDLVGFFLIHRSHLVWRKYYKIGVSSMFDVERRQAQSNQRCNRDTFTGVLGGR